MNAARRPRADRREQKLLAIDRRRGDFSVRSFDALGELLRPGDLLVVNDAATLPASLRARLADGREIEVRLLHESSESSWQAVLFDGGNWRQDTRLRLAPPQLDLDAALEFQGGLRARVAEISTASPRLVRLEFAAGPAEFWPALYRAARLIQYSYLDSELPLWSVQTAYASRPWAVEMPSAGWPLHWEQLLRLRRHGITVAPLTHATGLSSTGDPALDDLLPLPERYELPESTVEHVRRVRRAGGRVIAAGTSVVRALEGAAAGNQGILRPGRGETALRIGPETRLQVVDGILSGIHVPGESHFALMQAFAPAALLEKAHRGAQKAGFLTHEFGDSCIIL
jgi:S-adenosylmethionine:tRNA ribosyltransferase-isomerase